MPYTSRVDNAVTKIEASRDWTKTQRQWLRRLGRALKEQPIGDLALVNEGAFAQNGGFDVINQAFDNRQPGLTSTMRLECCMTKYRDCEVLYAIARNG